MAASDNPEVGTWVYSIDYGVACRRLDTVSSMSVIRKFACRSSADVC